MADKTKKYLQNDENDYPAIGNFVHYFIIEMQVAKLEVAKSLGIVPATLRQYFKQKSLQFGILWKISQAINYNLVMDLGQRLNIPFETRIEKELRDQLSAKDELIQKLEIQLETLREVRS